MQKALVFCVSCALAWAAPALAQLRDSTVTGVRSKTCQVVSPLPGVGSLRWEASLLGETPSSQLLVRRTGLGRGEAQVVVNLTTPAELIKQCELYGVEGQEIGVVRLRPEEGASRHDIFPVVQLLPALEHVRTLAVSPETEDRLDLNHLDYYDWWRGDPLGITRLRILPYAGGLFGSYEVLRRPLNADKLFIAGGYIESLVKKQPALPPPWWMDQYRAADVLPLGPSQPGPSHPVLAPVVGRSVISAVILAPPWLVFPPRELVLNARIYTRQGIKRAHGLLTRDLSRARKRDRQSKASWILWYLRKRKSEGESGLSPEEQVRTFLWSEEARRRFGPVRLTVVASNERTLIGTIERECPNPFIPDVAPGKDLWIFRVATDNEPPLWIDTEQVQSCTLIGLGELNGRWVDRTFDNGEVTVIKRGNAAVGLKAVLKPPTPFFFDGRIHKAGWEVLDADVAGDYNYGEGLTVFEPDNAEVTYLLDTAGKQAPTDQP